MDSFASLSKRRRHPGHLSFAPLFSVRQISIVLAASIQFLAAICNVCMHAFPLYSGAPHHIVRRTYIALCKCALSRNNCASLIVVERARGTHSGATTEAKSLKCAIVPYVCVSVSTEVFSTEVPFITRARARTHTRGCDSMCACAGFSYCHAALTCIYYFGKSTN